jgi:hypothetical protein
MLLIGCASMTVSETEACNAILSKSETVELSRTDYPKTIQSVGELLIMIDGVCKGEV